MQKTLKTLLFRFVTYVVSVGSSFADFLFFWLHPMFTRPGRQIEIMRRLNEDREWRIPEEEFARIKKCIPRFPFGNSVAVVLVPYMHASPCRTFIEFCRTLGDMYPTFNDGMDIARTYRDSPITLLNEKESHQIGLRWEVINLSSHYGESSFEVGGRHSPHAGILAAALLHPDWLQNCDRAHGPSVCMPGYKIPGVLNGDSGRVPRLVFETLMNRPVLEYRPCKERDELTVVPEWVAC